MCRCRLQGGRCCAAAARPTAWHPATRLGGTAETPPRETTAGCRAPVNFPNHCRFVVLNFSLDSLGSIRSRATQGEAVLAQSRVAGFHPAQPIRLSRFWGEAAQHHSGNPSRGQHPLTGCPPHRRDCLSFASHPRQHGRRVPSPPRLVDPFEHISPFVLILDTGLSAKKREAASRSLAIFARLRGLQLIVWRGVRRSTKLSA